MKKNYTELCKDELPTPGPTLPEPPAPLTRPDQIESTVNESTIIARLAAAYGEMSEDELRALSWTDKVRIAQGKPVEKPKTKGAVKATLTEQCEAARKEAK